jgi:multidrug efflux pump subunit AcrA (membrane-fusion protein)
MRWSVLTALIKLCFSPAAEIFARWSKLCSDAAFERLCDGQLQGTQLTRVPGTNRSTSPLTVSERKTARPRRVDLAGEWFAFPPPDNATGNFTKVVHRMPVRIRLDNRQPRLERLLPGMSVVTNILTLSRPVASCHVNSMA